jgi:hypothetical protein
MAATSLAPLEDEGYRATNQAEKQVDFAPRLDLLPAELRSHILHCLDLDTLSDLVHASPIYHAQYREGRGSILLDSVERTAPDAFVIRLARIQRSDFTQDVAGFLQTFSGAIARKELTHQGQADKDVAVDMAHFYFNVVKPLGDNFASLALEKLAQETALPEVPTKQSLTLTRSERARITRAMYRFELFCEVVQSDGYSGYEKRDNDTYAFLNTMEPWEVEELLSFYESTQLIYFKLADRVTWDLHPDNPRSDDQK